MINKLTTKDYIEMSAREMLSNSEITNVTVKDICDNCNISTRTFYKYYRDKYDVINKCLDSKLEEFYDQSVENINLRSFLIYTTSIVNDHIPFYENVFRYTGQNNIRSYLVKPLSANYLRIIRDYCNAEITPEIENAVNIFILGQLAYVEEALTRTTIPGNEESVAYFECGIPACLMPFFDTDYKK